MNQIQLTDFWILSSFSERVRAIPEIQEQTIAAAQQLLAEAQKTIAELERNGHSHEDALHLCNQVVNTIQNKISKHERQRYERERRREAQREINAEARYNR